jgi:Lon protease-like protein
VPHQLLPIFPLPLVLFPGASLPLHIFEPRYRELLADCRRGDGRFGVVLATGGPERELPRGRVGCVAEVQEVHALPDGRSNVLVEGVERFAFEEFVDSPASYFVGEVSAYEDEPVEDAEELRTMDAEVRTLFARVARAARAIADDNDPVPTLPPDPALLSFRVASLVDLDNDARQRLLVSRSPAERLREIDDLLSRAAEGIEERAAVHVRARTNGHGPGMPPAAEEEGEEGGESS